MKLYDHASVIRSKNAGPFTLTLDLIFSTEEAFDVVLEAQNFNAEHIADLYDVSPDNVSICPFKKALAIKVTLPRGVPSGSLGDTDVYGCQQHFPLADIEI